MPSLAKQKKSYKDQKLCHISKKEFTDDENYCNLQDLFHYTGR